MHIKLKVLQKEYLFRGHFKYPSTIFYH